MYLLLKLADFGFLLMPLDFLLPKTFKLLNILIL
jgi:hypothetical protein